MQRNSLTLAPFAQRIRDFFTVENGLGSDSVLSLAFDSHGTLYAGTQKGLFFFDGKRFSPVKGVLGAVGVLFGADDCLYAGSKNTVIVIKDGKVLRSETLDSNIAALDTDGNGTLWLVTENTLYSLKDEKFERYHKVDDGNATGMACYGDRCVYVISPTALKVLHGKRPHWSAIMPVYSSAMPEGSLQALAADKWGHLWLGTENGLSIYDSKGFWLTEDKIDALPSENIRKIVLGKNGARYIGTDIGLIIQSGVKQHFLGAERWLPDGKVTAVAVSDDGREIWVGTEKGISRITTKMMTLAEKAEVYQESCEKYHVREGYVTKRILNTPGNIEDGHVEVSDNDGLWTANYVACQAYCYAVTGKEVILQQARRSMKAMLKLMKITDKPGFTARSYRRPGEEGFGNGDIEWHLTEDEKGALEWKCETSSDEMVGHFYGLSTYYDLCADDNEKAEITEALCAIVDHILDNDYYLCDIDGKPTTWACWNPHELNNNDQWFWERGINSLEMLMMLKTVFYMSGKAKYDEEYKMLVTKHHFALNCVQHKIFDANVTHIDDNLGFLSIVPLLKYESDPELRQYYLLGMRHHWESQLAERCPMWNLIYCAFSGEIKGLDAALQSLSELPLDLLHWTVTNSLRRDLDWDCGQEEYGGIRQLKSPLPYDEKPITKYDANPFLPDKDNGNRRVEDGTIFLHPYWFGRYYGLIGE